ncbi:MAG: hypothetical protein ACTSRI_18765 [Promethearchaeota archaeon]
MKEELLKKGESVPLVFTPKLILKYYNSRLSKEEEVKSLEKLTPSTLSSVIKGLLDKKGKYHEEITGWICSEIVKKEIVKKENQLYGLFLNPSMEVKLEDEPHQMKLRGLIADPRVHLHPFRILPSETKNKNYNCHLILSGPKECRDLFSLRTHLFDCDDDNYNNNNSNNSNNSNNKKKKKKKYCIPIPPRRDEDLGIGVDINQETTANVVVISPDWNSVLRKNPLKNLRNTIEEQRFTSYVHDRPSEDGKHSELSCDGVNVLSGEISQTVGKIKVIKKNKKNIQRKISRLTIQAKAGFKEFIENTYHFCLANNIPSFNLRDLSEAVRQCPAWRVHKLKQIRAQRQGELFALFREFNILGLPFRALKEDYEKYRALGKHIYRLTIQLKGHQGRLNRLRKELMRLVSRIIAAVIISERPRRFGHEGLSFHPQGLKGVLATAVQYMPKDVEVSRALELAENFYKRNGETFDVEAVAVNPRGTSKPPHIPSGRLYERTPSQWDHITIPKDPENGLPELRFNSHILASHKIAERALITEI